MLNSGVPPKFPIPFANSAGVGKTRAIPTASQIAIQNGAASLTDGFPPNCFVPIASGGSWPFGADFNGILNQITAWLRFLQAGGFIAYDAAFQTAIGGYPNGSRVWSATTPFLLWESLVDNNTSNPDAGGAGWGVPRFADPGIGGLIIQSTTGNGANLQFIGNGATTPNKWIRAINGLLDIINSAYSAAIFTLNDFGDIFNVRDINMNRNLWAQSGTVTALQLTSNGNINAAGSITAGGQVNGNTINSQQGIFYVASNAAYYWGHSSADGAWRAVENNTINFTLDAAGNLTARNGVNGVGYITSSGGSVSAALDVTAGRNMSAVGSISGASVFGNYVQSNGNVQAAGTFTGGAVAVNGTVSGLNVQANAGNVTAFGGRLRATFGARGSGDAAAGVILNDFVSNFGDPGYVILPNGIIIQWQSNRSLANGDMEATFFPISFPNRCAGVWLNEASVDGWDDGAQSCTVFGIRVSQPNAFYARSARVHSGNMFWSGGLDFNWIAVGW